MVARALQLAGAISVLMTLSTIGAPVTPEYKIKAVFLYNFVQFVHWPAQAFEAPDAPLVIGVLGKDPFGVYLDEAIAHESIHGHPLAVRRSQQLDDLEGVQMLFISRSEAERVPEIIAALEAKPILIVGESAGFAQHGGVIRLYLSGNKVRFEINVAAARQRGLRLSTQLLKLGTSVGREAAR